MPSLKIGFITDQHWKQDSTHEGGCFTGAAIPWESDASSVTNAANGAGIDYMFGVGDQLHRESITDAQLEGVIGDYKTAMDNFNGTWYWGTLGNHDWHDTLTSCTDYTFEKTKLETALAANGVLGYGDNFKVTVTASWGQKFDIISMDSVDTRAGQTGGFGYISPSTQTWLQNNLHESRVTFILSHVPQDESSDTYIISNPTDINDLLDEYGNVKAVLTGHTHHETGNTAYGTKNIPWIHVRRAGSSYGASKGWGYIEIEQDVGATYYGVRNDQGDTSGETLSLFEGSGETTKILQVDSVSFVHTFSMDSVNMDFYASTLSADHFNVDWNPQGSDLIILSDGRKAIKLEEDLYKVI